MPATPFYCSQDSHLVRFLRSSERHPEGRPGDCCSQQRADKAQLRCRGAEFRAAWRFCFVQEPGVRQAVSRTRGRTGSGEREYAFLKTMKPLFTVSVALLCAVLPASSSIIPHKDKNKEKPTAVDQYIIDAEGRVNTEGGTASPGSTWSNYSVMTDL